MEDARFSAPLLRAFGYHPAERSFYVADEILEWFNQVNQAYRNELRDLNELNFQRISARLDERVGASEAKVEVRLSQFEQRLAAFESKIEQRMAAFDRNERGIHANEAGRHPGDVARISYQERPTASLISQTRSCYLQLTGEVPVR